MDFSEFNDDLLVDEGSLTVVELKQSVRKAGLLRLARQGVDATKAAKIVGVSAETVRKDYRDPKFQQLVQEGVEEVYGKVDEEFRHHRQSMHALLEEQAYESFFDLKQMLRNGDLSPGLRVKIHQDFLDRTPKTAQHHSITNRMDPEQLALAAEAARLLDSKVVDVTPRKED